MPASRRFKLLLNQSLLMTLTMAVVVAETAEEFPRIGRRNHFRVATQKTPTLVDLTGKARDHREREPPFR
eukprot:s140_g25.t1